MKLLTAITAVVLGASAMTIQPASAQYFDLYSDPFENIYRDGINQIQQIHDNFDRQTRSRQSSNCRVQHAYGDTYSVNCF